MNFLTENSISEYICIFMFFSFVGWIWDTFFDFCLTKRLTNRGFLYGPFCPIYGFAVLIGFYLYYYIEMYELTIKLWQLFLISFIVATTLEYVTAYILEKIFNATWWDYSELPFNIKGRVSLFTSIGFGLGGILIMEEIIPYSIDICNEINATTFDIISYVFVIIFSVDLAITINALYQLGQTILVINDSISNKLNSTADRVFNRQKMLVSKIRSMDYLSRNTLFRLKRYNSLKEINLESVINKIRRKRN